MPGQKNIEKGKADFLKYLLEGDIVSVAITRAGFGRTSAYRWKDEDAVFNAAWDECVDIGTDKVEGVLETAALKAADDPRYTVALIFYLKNRRPGVWADRRELNLSGTVSIEKALELLDNEKPPEDDGK